MSESKEFYYIAKVINSCTTTEQLEVCEKWLDLKAAKWLRGLQSRWVGAKTTRILKLYYHLGDHLESAKKRLEPLKKVSE